MAIPERYNMGYNIGVGGAVVYDNRPRSWDRPLVLY